VLKQMFIAICLALPISGLTGCASTPRNLMEERAGYDIRTPPMLLPSEKNGRPVAYVPVRVPKKQTLAWLHEHDINGSDRFLGGWLSLLVSNESWEMKPVELPVEKKLKSKKLK
jgi:hypothetical protein